MSWNLFSTFLGLEFQISDRNELSVYWSICTEINFELVIREF